MECKELTLNGKNYNCPCRSEAELQRVISNYLKAIESELIKWEIDQKLFTAHNFIELGE